MTDLLTYLLFALAGSYALFTLALGVLWGRIKVPTGTSARNVRLSVVIPVRNEADNILHLLQDLASQTLPAIQFEVLVIDDASTDATATLVEQWAHQSTYPLRLIRLPDEPSTSPKKRAIETAIAQATGTLIVTTDGDCRVPPTWLESIARGYQASGARLISGPVTFTPESTLTDHLQTVEFSSLIGSGACSLAAGVPSMCNGANLAYEKAAFEAVGGYEGVRHIASGDDEFLMHKLAARYPGQIVFLKDAGAIVRTQPHRQWRQFYRQRKRWASKWKHYQNPATIALAVYIFACNASLLVALGAGLAGVLSGTQVLAICLLKCLSEWFFIGRVLWFLKKKKSLIYIPLVQLIYPFYVTFFGLAVQKPQYEWKGRKLV